MFAMSNLPSLIKTVRAVVPELESSMSDSCSLQCGIEHDSRENSVYFQGYANQWKSFLNEHIYLLLVDIQKRSAKGLLVQSASIEIF